MQSNMAATLNIDWLVDRGARGRRAAGPSVRPQGPRWRRSTRGCSRPSPAAALYHPYIHEAGERGPFVDANARAQFTGLSMRTSFLDLVRAVYEGLASPRATATPPWAIVPEEIRLTGGAARSKALQDHPRRRALDAPVRESSREEAGAAGAAMMAAVAVGVFPDLAAATDRWVDAAAGRSRPARPGARRASTPRPSRPIVATRKAMPPVWADLAAIRTGASA